MRRISPSDDSSKKDSPQDSGAAPNNPVISPEIAKAVQQQAAQQAVHQAPNQVPQAALPGLDQQQVQKVAQTVTVNEISPKGQQTNGIRMERISTPNQPLFSQQQSNGNGNTNMTNTMNKPSLARAANMSPISRNQSSAAMENIRKAIEDLGASSEFESFSLTMLELDRNGANRNLSALIVCATERNKPGAPVAFHTLLLEETGAVRTVRRRLNNGTNVGINNGGTYDSLLYPSDGYDQFMREAVILTVAKKFGNGTVVVDKEKNQIISGNVVLLDAMASTVPATLDLSKVPNVRGAVSNGSVAATTVLRTYLGVSDDFKLEGDVQGQRWTTSILVSDAAFSDLMGIPMRGDVVLELREGGNDGNNNGQNNQSYNDPAGEVLTHQVLGFQDFAYQPSPAAQMAQMNGALMAGAALGMGIGMGMNMGGVDPSAYLTFRSRYIITNLDPIWNPTLPDTLMGLAPVQCLLEEKRFQSLWVKRHMLGAQNPINGKNLHDLGALGLEVLRPGIGDQAGQMVKSRFPTTGAKGEEPVLFSILNSVVHPDAVVSMDISETGTFSWIHGVFASAALGSVESNNEIIGAADYVTRGNFSKIYAQECGGNALPVMINDGVLINMGRYTDANGQLRDVREVDQLVIENAFGESSPEMVDRWIRMNYDTSIDEEFRLVELREIIKQLYSNVTFTGRARRVTFQPAFLKALNRAIAACGGRFMARWGNEAPQSTNRATASFLSGLHFNNGVSGAYVQGYRPQVSNLGLGTTSFGRWM